jgi:hypothetical protein
MRSAYGEASCWEDGIRLGRDSCVFEQALSENGMPLLKSLRRRGIQIGRRLHGFTGPFQRAHETHRVWTAMLPA